MKHLQKAFSSPLPRLMVVVKEESEELVQQLQQASAASDGLTVVLAVEKDSKRLIDYYGVKAGEGATLLLEDPKAAGGAAAKGGGGGAPRDQDVRRPGGGAAVQAARPHARQVCCDLGAQACVRHGMSQPASLPRPAAAPPPAAKYLKEGAKPSDVPEFLREFQVGGGRRSTAGTPQRAPLPMQGCAGLLPPPWRLPPAQLPSAFPTLPCCARRRACWSGGSRARSRPPTTAALCVW
jgi:hypothetical protein